MMEQNNFNLGSMHIEFFLPSEKVRDKVLIPKLSHGSHIVAVQTGDEDLADCDALITQNRSFSLGIRTADCAPICFGDGEIIGIAHIGWRGLCQGLIEKMQEHFRKEELSVYVGPFLHSFEIKKDFCYEQLTKKFADYIEEQSDKIVFNFKDAISSLLPPHTVYDARDTATELSFPSHRRDKTKERFVSVASFPKV